MWPIPTAWLWGGAAAVAASGYLLAGVQTVRLSAAETEAAEVKERQAKADLRSLELAAQARAELQGRADTQAAKFEAWKARQRPRVLAIQKEVRDAQAVDPVCPDRALPAGLRDALRRAPEAVGARDAGEPGGMPGVVGR